MILHIQLKALKFIHDCFISWIITYKVFIIRILAIIDALKQVEFNSTLFIMSFQWHSRQKSSVSESIPN